uniref:Mitochondrial inner membrane protease subunit n=1 Tax=Solanum tuberosum TaxID=4113 RepID=M1AFU0_SOLTU
MLNSSSLAEEYGVICNVQGQRILSPSSKPDCRLQPNNVLQGSLLHHNEGY